MSMVWPSLQTLWWSTWKMIRNGQWFLSAYSWKPWTPYMEDLEICYQLEEKGSEIYKRMKKRSFHRHEGIPCAWRVLSMRHQANDGKKRWMGGNPSFLICFCFAECTLFLFKTIIYKRNFLLKCNPNMKIYVVFNKQVCSCCFFFRFASLAL